MNKTHVCIALLCLFITVDSAVCRAANAEKKTSSNTAETFVAKQRALGRKANRLLNEKSPYLLKHAFNPVDWFPWGEEAFAKSRKENKPILLSIGYATCHWCNVMGEESFDNEEIAKVVNESFVAIKVDREERPDIDSTYLAVTQTMTGSAGWPMTLFLSPDLKPLYAGTYFPPETKYGLPGFKEVLTSIATAWSDDRENLLQRADTVISRIRTSQQSERFGGKEINKTEVLEFAYNTFLQRYDKQKGGFGDKPKFPRPVGLAFLARYHIHEAKSEALAMVVDTLRAMAFGGIRDHIGGGFHRYTVDAEWRVPHFEKMLYDQAQLAQVYLEAFQLTKEELFLQTAEETLDFVLREMQGPDGGFYSALDADSPRPDDITVSGEGAYYLWSRKEIETVLGLEAAEVFNRRYGVAEKGNAPEDPLGEFTGRNILFIAETIDSLARHFKKDERQISRMLEESREKLLSARNGRIRPYLDNKVIVAWNGLMISSFVKGYQVTGKKIYLDAAREAADFVLTKLYDPATGLLQRRYRDGHAGIDGQLADYALMSQALLDLFQAAPELRYLQVAEKIAARSLSLFADQKRGGLFETVPDSTLLFHLKPDFESSEPSGNSISALNFSRFFHLTAEKKWHDGAENILKSFYELLDRTPASMPQLVVALDAASHKPKQIVIAGNPGAEDVKRMQREVFSRFMPYASLVLAEGGEVQAYLEKRVPAIGSMRPINGKATAYVCENFVCKAPVNDFDRFKKLLDQ